ncbi:hydrolase [Scheffersomyces xylosifermentans]|uniref:hydrolase n=1 Tax=Scheffersomyces xylosifermentans TaxID=1304137 RepID=UPI00315D2494
MSHSVHTSITDQQNDIYFGSEVVNRVSFLREDSDFIANSVSHPSTRFIFFDQSKPLISKNLENKLIILTNGDNQLKDEEGDQFKVIKKGLSSLPEWKKAVKFWKEANKSHDITLRDNGNPTFLFLGIEDASVGLDLKRLKIEDDDSSTGDDEKYLDHQGRYQGIPYYAVDLSKSKALSEVIIKFYNDELNKLEGNDPATTAEDNGVFYTHSRKHYLSFTHQEAALFSHGSMYLDWLSRNRFCASCGTKVIPIHAGGKLYCTNVTKRENGKYDCPVKNASVSNVSFPRTDAVIITAITDEDRTKVLLSLGKRHAATRMYACTAGFMEPSETVEVATKREIWEETGVVCSKINLVMTQPWPFPGNLMIGCLGVVEFNGVNENIHLGHDKELEDARWFDIDFVRQLVYPDEVEDIKDFNPENILIPMPESVAFSLIKLVVDQAHEHKKQKSGKL